MRFNFCDHLVEALRDILVDSPHSSSAEILRNIERELEEFNSPEAQAYRKTAFGMQKDGEIEVDIDATVSMGADDGAYVMAWLWVDNEAAGLSSEESKV